MGRGSHIDTSNNNSNSLFTKSEIKLLWCEEIGIFCMNFAEKFILKFAKLFYIKKHEDSCHSPAQFVIYTCSTSSFQPTCGHVFQPIISDYF